MVFPTFVFVCCFLPVALALYYFAQPRLRNFVLLATSLVFYSWGNAWNLAVLLAVALVTYLGALLPRNRWICGAFILANIAALCHFKFFGAAMPLGISFFVFQTVAYLVDVYRGDVEPETNFLEFLLFLSFFPKVSQGPIVKYKALSAEIKSRTETLALFNSGVRRFIVGFAKKILVANTMGAMADQIFGAPVDSFGPLVAWGGAIAYTLQLYFDFSGYSDMAIGLGEMFGFHISENFDFPYVSNSVTEFWRRWHITLGAWFRDYLYIPLGGNRVSKGRNLFNLSVVFLATGIWHGAAWTFVVWGAWHGAFIILERLTGWHKRLDSFLMRAVHHVYLLLIIIFGWVLFRADGFGYALKYMANMLGLLPVMPVYAPGYYFSPFNLIVMALGTILSFGICKNLLSAGSAGRWRAVALDAWLIVLFLLSAAFLAGSSYSPFIYFKF